MGEIDFTNIIVDDFRKGKLNPFNKYIYILTHIHSDHLRGLSNTWDYGPIYCSQVTANLILNKFPNLKNCIKIIPLEQPYKLMLAQNIQATITFFDANHCAGAVMVLFQGYFGRFLYTGDFRFDKKKFLTYSYLYPPQNTNQKFEGCSRSIDKMWLDNTFCNPRFKFLNLSEALVIVLDFFKEYIEKEERIYVGMDYYGKQQVLVHVAKELDTIIVVDEQRYQNLIAMQFDRELFTTNPQEGKIEVIQKPKLYQKLKQNANSIGLVMSGWSLQRQWRKIKGTNQNRIYYVPYSLHSNYQQIVSFVKSIKPSIIQPIVSLKQSSEGSISSDSMYNTEGNEQTFHNIIKNYTSPISSTFSKNLGDVEFHQALKKRFGLDRKSAQINKTELNLNTVHIIPRAKGGYKLNRERDQESINLVKQQYRKSRMMRKNKVEQIVINDDSEIDSSDIEVIEKKQPQIVEKKKHLLGLKPDWKKLNQIQFVMGEKELEKDFQSQIREMIMNMK